MAVTVEDGSVVANANSYTSTADADAYYQLMGYSESATKGSVVRGSRALDERYRSRLEGYKSTAGQTMAWPRDGVTDEDGNSIGSDEIPARVVMAAQEMARTLDAAQTIETPSSIKSVKAGSVEVEFSGPQAQETVLSYIDRLMETYLSGGGNAFVRA